MSTWDLFILGILVWLGALFLLLYWDSKPKQPIPQWKPAPKPIVLRFANPHILDGDSISIKGRHIHMYGIDAPEYDQPYGTEATQALARILRQQEIVCKLHGKDKYNRDLGVCYIKGKDVNAWMVRNGYAWSYWEYKQEEARARRERRGVHRSTTSIHPAQWRRRTKHPERRMA